MRAGPGEPQAAPHASVRGVAIGVALFLGLAGGLLTNWWAGAMVMALGLVVAVRPFDLFVSLVLVAAMAAFAEYGDPHIVRDLAIASLLTLYTLASLFAAWLTGRWRLPVSRLGDALAALAVTTAVGTVHGVLAHQSIRFIFLETFPLFALILALTIGGARIHMTGFRIAKWALIGVALASAALGYKYYAVTGMRTQGLPFSPMPGLVAILVLTLMLFEPSPRPRLVPVLIFCALIGHQIITFTRGFWLALMVAIPFALVLYVRWGAGAGLRWKKVLRTLGLIALVAVPAAMVASTMVGWSEIVEMVGGRFASSFETKNTPETVSNIVRLVEFRTSMKFILAQPWLGYGHGATLIVRQFFHPITGAQWWVHESYLMIWFKQGLFGLGALLWVIWEATWVGIRGSRHSDPQVAGWFAASAACTVFAAVVGLTNYYFFMVTMNFTLALLWGITLPFARPGHRQFVWRALPKFEPPKAGS